VRSDLAQNLDSGRALARLGAFAQSLRADPSGRAPRGDGPAVRAAVAELEVRTGLRLRGPGAVRGRRGRPRR